MRENSQSESAPAMTRRRLLKAAAIGVAALMVPGAVRADEWIRLPARSPLRRVRFLRRTRHALDKPRQLSFYNVHTGEALKTVYWEDGDYVPGALREVNYFFRDFRANEVKSIDPGLLDLLYDIRSELETSRPFNLVSGYRSPTTNAWLASVSRGVASDSQHMNGNAMDIRFPGVPVFRMQQAARSLDMGGVGFYPRSGFVHIDTGPVRYW